MVGGGHWRTREKRRMERRARERRVWRAMRASMLLNNRYLPNFRAGKTEGGRVIRSFGWPGTERKHRRGRRPAEAGKTRKISHDRLGGGRKEVSYGRKG